MKKRLIKIISTTLCLMALALILTAIYLKTGMGLPCPISYYTPFLCPGCGTTRMICSIILLDFKTAFCYNPLMFILLPFILAYLIYLSYGYIKKGKFNIGKKDFIAYIILAVILFAYAVIRNIFGF